MDDKAVKKAEKLGVLGGTVVGEFYSLLIVAVCGLLQFPYIVPVLGVFLFFALSLIKFKNEAEDQGKLK